MAEIDQIRIDLDGIGHALADRYLSVPAYQRSYAWEEKQITDLFADIANAIAKGEKEYFLGSIVIVDKEDRHQVVDGQQRLATISILLSAIRDYFLQNGEKERASELETKFLVTRDLRTLENIPRLRLNDADNDFFLNNILSAQETQTNAQELPRESHRRLLHAAKVSKERVKIIAKQTPNPTDRLLDWVEYVERSLRVIWVRVPDDVNAFVMFETLNDRGLRLSAADLLKNYLFGQSQDRINEAQHYWIAMTGVLEAVGDEDTLVTYIRHYWSSYNGLTRERELYGKMKGQVTSKQAAIDLSSDLEANASLYTALLNPQHETWTKYGATARQHLHILHILRMVQNRPLLLAILKHFDIHNVKESLRLIVSWSVRFLICGGIGSGGMEQRYSESARRVRNEEIKDVRKLAEFMSDIVPNDAQFAENFVTAQVSKAYLARYYLRALEKEARGEGDPELVPNTNEEQVNLEHVLPQNPSDAWKLIDEEITRAYYSRIGNLALMKSQPNVEIGNASFSEKRPHYAKSEYKLTARIAADFTDWNVEEISKRQEGLARLAVKTWPIEIR